MKGNQNRDWASVLTKIICSVREGNPYDHVRGLQVNLPPWVRLPLCLYTYNRMMGVITGIQVRLWSGATLSHLT